MATQTSRKGYATTAQVAAHTGFTPKTLRNWRAAGKGPRFTGRGRSVRYRWADVEAWMATRDAP